MRKDFYAILSVPRNAKAPEIKSRFLALARERHPDRFQGEEKDRAEDEFQNLTEAFNVLMDPTRRRQHGLELEMPITRSGQDPAKVARVYLNRGIRAYKKGNLAEAADSFERATQSDPENYQPGITWRWFAARRSAGSPGHSRRSNVHASYGPATPRISSWRARSSL